MKMAALYESVTNNIIRDLQHGAIPCPVCPKAGERALVIAPGKGFYCWGVRKGGDQIALAAHILGIGLNEAAAFLAGDQEHSAPSVPESEKGQENVRTLQPLSYLEPEHEAVDAVGFHADDANRFEESAEQVFLMLRLSQVQPGHQTALGLQGTELQRTTPPNTN